MMGGFELGDEMTTPQERGVRDAISQCDAMFEVARGGEAVEAEELVELKRRLRDVQAVLRQGGGGEVPKGSAAGAANGQQEPDGSDLGAALARQAGRQCPPARRPGSPAHGP